MLSGCDATGYKAFEGVIFVVYLKNFAGCQDSSVHNVNC